jgi:DNA-binding FadR family transcriptional regulator
VVKAYEHVADQLREAIAQGDLRPGERLPNEVELASDFGVSRATIREALRVLSAQNLLSTTKGTGGGTYVTLPKIEHISSFLHANIALLAESQDVSLEDFLEARELLEIPAARKAAERRTEEDLERIRATIPSTPRELRADDLFAYNKDFHAVLVTASQNNLLVIATHPVFSVLHTNLARATFGTRFHKRINDDHTRIADAIAAGDADAAGEEMSRHLEVLREYYTKAWRHREGQTSGRRLRRPELVAPGC